jgi:hypothetical protein
MTPNEILTTCAMEFHAEGNPPLYCGACVARALAAERELCAKIAEEMTMRGEVEETRGYVRCSLIAERLRGQF